MTICCAIVATAFTLFVCKYCGNRIDNCDSLILCLNVAHASEVPDRYEKEIEAYLKDELKIYKNRIKKVLPLVPFIVKTAIENNVDPLLVSIIIYHESSWRVNTPNGKIGERGLMQVHGVAAKGHNTSTPKGQLEAGITHLARCKKVCCENGCEDETKMMLGCYQTGRCIESGSFIRRRHKKYMSVVKKYRREK